MKKFMRNKTIELARLNVKENKKKNVKRKQIRIRDKIAINKY